MAKLIDLTGQRFGRLLVIERAENDKYGKGRWSCRCECGKQVVVCGNSLRHGITRSCGCLRREVVAEIDKSRATHGQSRSRIYRIWQCMRVRCSNPKARYYPLYGGRGIRVCPEWQHFEPFYDWAMANGYKDSLSIDRIDVNGNYCPENCRWATAKEQARNQRSNRLVLYNGKTQTIADWADELNINPITLRTRLSHGWSVEEALTTPVNKNLSRSKK